MFEDKALLIFQWVEKYWYISIPLLAALIIFISLWKVQSDLINYTGD